jgi:hypothetical protein
VVKGKFFPGDEKQASTLYFPFEISRDHLRGWWIRQGEEAIPKRFVDSRWLVLPKRRWLSPAWCDEEELHLLLADDGISEYCSHHFENNNSSLLVAEMQAGRNGWSEVSRGFIVCSTWPMVGR